MKKLLLKERIALKITSWVSTIECAIAFTVLALISLPTAIQGGVGSIVSWTAQTFLQLVLLSIIMIGQDVQGRDAEARAEKHYQIQLKHENKIDIILKLLTVDKLFAMIYTFCV
jgi:uncharacterized membrane protein